MIVVRDPSHNKHSSPSVAAIGNFDGLHCGHRVMIDQMLQKAKATGLVGTVITFEPMPRAFLKPHEVSLRLMRPCEKILTLASWGVEQVICLRFNNRLANMTAFEFMQFCTSTLQVKHLFVGQDFQFGHNREGNVEFLKQNGFECDVIDLVYEEGQKISSTAIRQALKSGNLKASTHYLGRPYSISGKVVFGAQRGRQLGFPTANLPLRENESFIKGIFVTRVTVGNKKYNAVTNVGSRPTLDGNRNWIESYLLNFTGNLYGQRITIEFLEKLRDEMRFENKEALILQINQDVKNAERYFASLTETA